MKVDPLASMRCWAVDVELGGRAYTVPALPAADWWPVLVTGDVTQVLDLLMSGSSDELADMILTGEVTREEISGALTEAIEEVAGRSLHVATVLALAAWHSWSAVNGYLAQRGFRWDLMPLGAALDAVHAVLLDMIEDKDDRAKFVRMLENEPGKRDREKMAADFETLAGPKPSSGVRSSGARSGSARPKTRPRHQQPRPDDLPASPTAQPGPPAESDPQASSEPPAAGAGPASA